MTRTPLDTYDTIAPDMRAYLGSYGWHFNKKVYTFAVQQMKSTAGKQMPYTKEDVEAMLKTHGVELKNNVGYDAVYVASMCKADYYGSSIADDKHMALFIKDTIDDVDAADGNVMRKWYASMVGAGIPVEWAELL